MKIIADEHIPCLQDYFSEAGELILLPGRKISAADVVDADMLLVRSVTPVTEALLSDSKVKFVGSVTAGTDHLDIEYLEQAGIAWANAAGFNAPPVADYVVCVIAALQKHALLTGEKKRAAVIGVGKAGSLVVNHLRALNFDVILCDPYRADAETDFQSISFNELTDVDLISLHVPLSKAGAYPTYHLIDESFLKRQKEETVLLNASRGAVIDTEALLAHGGHIHSCLDVFEHEPHINKAVLERSLIATPHIAGYSVQSKLRGTEMIYQAACNAKIIKEKKSLLTNLPRQQLNFARDEHTWREVVLGVFNPLVMTAMMRSMLLSVEDGAYLFDEMRRQFNYRNEFAYVDIADVKMSSADQELLDDLGFHLKTHL